MAYSNVRYTRTRHSPKLITPIQAKAVVQPIQELQPKQAIQPYYPYRGLDEKRRAYERARQDSQTKTFLGERYSICENTQCTSLPYHHSNVRQLYYTIDKVGLQ